MARYLSTISFTDQGIREASQSKQRASKFRSLVESRGGKVISMYWALGEVDGFVVFECPDDSTAASLMLKLGKEGNVRTKTTRVFDAAEFETIVASSN